MSATLSCHLFFRLLLVNRACVFLLHFSRSDVRARQAVRQSSFFFFITEGEKEQRKKRKIGCFVLLWWVFFVLIRGFFIAFCRSCAIHACMPCCSFFVFCFVHFFPSAVVAVVGCVSGLTAVCAGCCEAGNKQPGRRRSLCIDVSLGG